MSDTRNQSSASAVSIDQLISQSVLATPPALLFKIINSLDSEMTSQQIGEIIGHDQSLSAQIMRLANSSFFGFKGEVKTLDRAISILGTKMVLNIAVTSFLVAQTGAVKLYNLDLANFWMHSFLVADFARELAQLQPRLNQNEAYIAGLLHDTGKLILYAQQQPPTALFDQMYDSEQEQHYEQQQWQIDSNTLTQKLLQRWNIPGEIVAAITGIASPTTTNKMAIVLYLANELSSLVTDPRRRTNLRSDQLEHQLERLEFPLRALIDYMARLPLVVERGRQIMRTILKTSSNDDYQNTHLTLVTPTEASLTHSQLALQGFHIDVVNPEQFTAPAPTSSSELPPAAAAPGMLARLCQFLNKTTPPAAGAATRIALPDTTAGAELAAISWQNLVLFDHVEPVEVPRHVRVLRIDENLQPVPGLILPTFFCAAELEELPPDAETTEPAQP